MFILEIRTYQLIRAVAAYALCRSNHLSQTRRLFVIFGGISFISLIFLALVGFGLMVGKYKLLSEVMLENLKGFTIFSIFFLLILSISWWYWWRISPVTSVQMLAGNLFYSWCLLRLLDSFLRIFRYLRSYNNLYNAIFSKTFLLFYSSPLQDQFSIFVFHTLSLLAISKAI